MTAAPYLITALLALAALAWAAWNRAQDRRRAAGVAREAMKHEAKAADVERAETVRVAVEVRAEGEKVRPVDLFNEIGRMKP